MPLTASCPRPSSWSTYPACFYPAAHRHRRRRRPDTDSVIAGRHVSEPGLVVLGIPPADEETARALMDGLQRADVFQGNVATGAIRLWLRA
ncbi:DUF6207 family protein [Streptomyces sp. McG3]|uniref:DUF6207 family protein n=1 Tax=Streptomyces sp. McG3 TaxID=2725483 RepID=UPI001BE93560|nr:DUF6207 family protein [Streptomyces sp. McG3]MBT2896318.1 hypothetical protein [Streptomyces sp. McG3]